VNNRQSLCAGAANNQNFSELSRSHGDFSIGDVYHPHLWGHTFMYWCLKLGVGNQVSEV
jgi:hypothetical protein